MSDDIRFTAKLKGDANVARLLRRHPEKIARTLESLVKQEARGMAVELARYTRPYGFSERAKKKGEKAVAADIRSVFTVPSAAYEELRKSDPSAADRFWANIQNRRFAFAAETGWSEEQILHMPLARLAQYQHCLLRRNGIRTAWSGAAAETTTLQQQIEALRLQWLNSGCES